MRASEGPEAYLGRAAGAVVGLAGGFYGAAAGLVLGAMVDVTRAERKIRRYFHDPAAATPPEALPGLAAAAALALRGPWVGGEDALRRRDLLLRLAEKRFGLKAGDEAALSRLATGLLAAEAVDLGLMARRLALEGDEEARRLLAEFAYGLARLKNPVLDHRIELGIKAALADTGITGETLTAARTFHFPTYRDPWKILELTPGASEREIKSAYRRLSKRLHPDLAGVEGAKVIPEIASVEMASGRMASDGTASDGTASFLELRAAYETLLGAAAD